MTRAKVGDVADLPEHHRRVLIDGVAFGADVACLPVSDAGVARGDGAFETIGVFDGVPFRLDEHLDRLDASLAALLLPAADHRRVREDVAVLLDGVGQDAALRVQVTASGTRLTSLSPLPDRQPPRSLQPVPAPWIAPSMVGWGAGAKSMSYAFNMAATRHALAAGADDALLVAPDDGVLLEGPTFGVLFVARGVVHAPSTELGIIDSISRRTLVEIARDHELDVLEGRWRLDALGDATEVIISSALRDAIAIERVGSVTLPRATPVRDLLSAELARRRRPTPRP